jgi:hypothetical protein
MSGKNKQQDSGRLGWVLFFIGFIGALFVGWVIFPQLLYSSKEQPLNFNHATHQEKAGLACEDCHQFREDGSYVGIPKLANCIQCHESPMTDSKTEAKLVSDYIQPGKEIPWLSYSREPDNVFFSHAAHVKLAQMACTECHRDATKEKATSPVRVNRLTGYPNQLMKMYVCEDCHAQKHVGNGCDVCHK